MDRRTACPTFRRKPEAVCFLQRAYPLAAKNPAFLIYF
jgi:hypothetical protein